jgi:uncharacterized protein with PQ loop repeat
MIELIGWIGAAGFALCGVPQAYHSVKTGKAGDINWLFITLWLIGELATIFYIGMTTRDPILLVNYTCNLLCLLVIIKVKLNERGNL